MSKEIRCNNFDLNKTEVKKLLLEKIKPGQVFYIDDICNKYGLDLETAVNSASELKQEGVFKEKI